MLLGLALRVRAALHLDTLSHPDEVYQTLEPAHRLAFGYGVISWEWRDGIRSWIFPGVLAVIMRLTDWIGAGSTGYLLSIRILLSLSSVIAIWFAYAWIKLTRSVTEALFGAFACAVWYDLVAYSPHALTEVVATPFLLMGLYLGNISDDTKRPRLCLFAGAFACGLAMSLRIQLLPAVLAIFVFISRKRTKPELAMTALGLLIPLAVFGFSDAIAWGHPFQSFYRYFWENAVQGKSLHYGTAPWYWYIGDLLVRLGPLFILAFIGARRNRRLAFVVAVILVSHSVLSHKESRFLYPALPLIIILSASGFWDLIEDIGRSFHLEVKQWLLGALGILGFALSSYAMSARVEPVSHPVGAMRALNQLSSAKDVCGVGLYRVPWFIAGGYSYLHKKVPLYWLRDEDRLLKDADSFNYLVTDERVVLNSKENTLVSCAYGTCVYKTHGRCLKEAHDDEINNVLLETGN
jgi:GPI mannosyltransferase 3